MPRLTARFDRPRRDNVKPPSKEFRQSLIIEAEKSEFTLAAAGGNGSAGDGGGEDEFVDPLSEAAAAQNGSEEDDD